MLSWLIIGCAIKKDIQTPTSGPILAEREAVVEDLHGVAVHDPYRWMEDTDDPRLAAWTEVENARYTQHTDALAQYSWLNARFLHLWRYDDETHPRPCLRSDRELSWARSAEQDKWVVRMREDADSPWRVLIDPNTWEATRTLAVFEPSPDCALAVIGIADAGNEDPVLEVIDLISGERFPDRMQGWKQNGVSWLHDNSGFYYSAKPTAEEVEVDGDQHYWHRAWLHVLGTDADQDTLVFSDPDTRETWHSVWLSEDGAWELRSRGLFNVNQMWIAPRGGEPVPMTDHMDIEYSVEVVDGRAFITTDWDAPNYRVLVADADRPQQDQWTELIPETEDRLSYISLIDGHLYAVYQQKAASRIDVYTLDGQKRGTIPLPAVGSADVSGYWGRPGVRLSFSSFAHPSSQYAYDVDANALSLIHASPIDVDTSNIAVEQVTYPSADGTAVTMFLIRRKDTDGPAPTLLTGYGGFNISMNPYFSTRNVVWLEAGGVVAIPNLRGGGEYGRTWHEAGMREHKQNVFDDFIAAAEWLKEQDITDTLAIAGGSNGGLLVSAAVTQRPALFDAVLCQVPLTDMVRFHRFGIANIWTEEYGSAEDPEMFPHIYAYSPYHRVSQGTNYPAILVTGSENDARTDPVHARKFMAAAQWADADQGQQEPIFLYIQRDSGHGGAVTIAQRADQNARHYAFLMQQLGMSAP